MQTLTCLSVGVARSPSGRGSVRQVFAHACNIALDGGGWLTLLTADQLDAPGAIRLDATCDLRTLFTPGEPFVLHDHGWQSTRCTASLLDVAHWRAPALAQPWLAADLIALHLAEAEQAWRQHHRGLTALPDLPLLDVLCQQLESALRQHQVQSLAAIVARMVGLGHGLTPSADDVLVGCLAGLWRLSQTEPVWLPLLQGLQQVLPGLLASTSEVSAHYLRLALDGWFSSPLERLRNSILTEPDGAQCQRDCQLALGIGASSGADGVRGLLLAYRARFQSSR
jgi:hypothetical protein